MHATQTSAPARPWWREPWPWLLMAGPFAAMIGCGVTIWLATSHPDAAIHDNVVRRGLVVEKPAAAPAHVMPAGAR
ncbi:MAG: FixH family protein [Pseudomonadota bacterium]|uniref:FixH family protein n=1 Tax=Ralstonia pickettii TaxID=329 RepID=UPI00211653D6|nr:FixH family protein [Ralstonia pickettii]MEE2979743.1 FixH family protein [Pseudomonadota bacterium]WKZ86580.1 FixH family protein [Ralstonia pickettii]